MSKDRARITIAIISAAIILLWQHPTSQIMIIVIAGLFGLLFYRDYDSTNKETTVDEHTY